VVNQKYQSSTDPEATLVRQHGVKTRPRGGTAQRTPIFFCDLFASRDSHNRICDFGGLTLDTPQNLDFALEVLAWGEFDSL
jgi:hypothetical protein